jgi:hypothetical protein
LTSDRFLISAFLSRRSLVRRRISFSVFRTRCLQVSQCQMFRFDPDSPRNLWPSRRLVRLALPCRTGRCRDYRDKTADVSARALRATPVRLGLIARRDHDLFSSDYYFRRSLAISANGANGMSDIEGKAAREAVSECGQRASFNWATAAWRSSTISAAMMSGSGRLALSSRLYL